ncbi:MAG: gephyrin-like molybdotransferase Glp [Planctomycetota bacterium]
MISVSEALSKIRSHIPKPRIQTISINDSHGYVAAEDIFSDIDLPPFNKSAMDGYAVRSEDLQRPPVELEVIETVAAGYYPSKNIKPGKAIKIMTGAPIPEGADAVIMVENTKSSGNNIINCLNGVRKGENIAVHGEDLKINAKVLPAGTTIRPQEVALLAAVGKSDVLVYSKPIISVLATGDELVDIKIRPVNAQIRNSNTYSLIAQLYRMGFKAHSLGIAKDNKSKLESKIARGLKSDIFILSGGVSVGDYDFVEEILKKSGCEIIFSKVAIKPGKPFLFGRTSGCLVFGLPGNPVSTFVITEIFIREALAGITGNLALRNQVVKARLNTVWSKISERQQYITALLKMTETGGVVEPVTGHGSADLVSLSKANAFLIVPPDTTEIVSGSMVDVIILS